MLYGCGDGRPQGQLFAKIQRGWANVRIADGTSRGWLIVAGNEKRESQTKYSASQDHERQILLLVYQ
jgi:hypothetical protein